MNRTECLRQLIYPEETTVDVLKFVGAEYDLTVLKVDPTGEFAYGFWYDHSFILDINSGHVTEIRWNEFSADVPILYPKDADIAVTNDGVRVALIVGYYDINAELALPGIYLIRLEPPTSMSFVDRLPLVNDTFVDGAFAHYYYVDYVMSVSIEDATQQVLVGLPYFGRTVLLKFNSTKLTLIRTFSYGARSVTWIDAGTQAALLLNDIPTPPWISSQIHVINTSATYTETPTLFAIPNNQQTISVKAIKQSNTFIRLSVSNGQPIALTNAGLQTYVPIAPGDRYIGFSEITSQPPSEMPCPPGTFKLRAGPSPCIVCPTGYKKWMNGKYPSYHSKEHHAICLDNSSATTGCAPCSVDSFCPLASVNNVNISEYPSTNQGYLYPNSPGSTNFDDIIITNTFQITQPYK